jgi:hypothetical protein
MIDSSEIMKGLFFINKKGKVIEICDYITIDNEKVSILAEESYLNSENEIENHKELYLIEDIHRLEIDKYWIEHLGFKLCPNGIYKLYDDDNKEILSYNLKLKKLGWYKYHYNHCTKLLNWKKCYYVSNLQFLIGFLRIRRIFSLY